MTGLFQWRGYSLQMAGLQPALRKKLPGLNLVVFAHVFYQGYKQYQQYIRYCVPLFGHRYFAVRATWLLCLDFVCTTFC